MQAKTTREKIIDDCLALIWRNGVNGTSMSDIAEKAAILKGSFYKRLARPSARQDRSGTRYPDSQPLIRIFYHRPLLPRNPAGQTLRATNNKS